MKLRQCYIKDNLCYIPLNNGQEAFTDKEFYDKVSKYNWYIHNYTISAYDGKIRLSIRKFLFPEYSYKKIKIVNNNRLDCRRINIQNRECFIKDNLCYIPLANCDKFAVCDVGSFDVVSKYKWYLGKNGYATTTLYINQKNKNVTLHKMLMPDYKKFIDHINRNKLDNRFENLRLLNHQQNIFNIGISINNTSGYKGVGFRKDRNKWRATIKKDGIYVHIGYYKTAEEAALAYNEKAKELFGVYAYLNEIKPVIKTVV